MLEKGYYKDKKDSTEIKCLECVDKSKDGKKVIRTQFG